MPSKATSPIEATKTGGLCCTSRSPVTTMGRSENFLYMNMCWPRDFDTPFLLAHLTFLNRQVPQLEHCDIVTTWAAGHGALSCCICFSMAEILAWHVALSPRMVHAASQPASGATTSLVVVALAVVVTALAVVVTRAVVALLASSLLVAAGTVAFFGAFVGAEACAVVSMAVVASVVGGIVVVLGFVVGATVVVLVLVAVLVTVSVEVIVSVTVLVWVAVAVAVSVGGGVVRVDVVVGGPVVVFGQPLPSWEQHQAFQSGVHAHSQISASALQS